MKLQILANRCQNDIGDRLLAATNCNLHGDSIGQRQASTNKDIVTSPEHTWEERDVRMCTDQI